MLGSNYNVHVDTAAYDKMFDHIRFLAQVSISAAERLYGDLTESIDFLKSSPASCPLYLSVRLKDVELHYKLCGKRYRIVFEIIGNDVFVYDIQDCRQDTDKSLVD